MSSSGGVSEQQLNSFRGAERSKSADVSDYLLQRHQRPNKNDNANRPLGPMNALKERLVVAHQ